MLVSSLLVAVGSSSFNSRENKKICIICVWNKRYKYEMKKPATSATTKIYKWHDRAICSWWQLGGIGGT